MTPGYFYAFILALFSLSALQNKMKPMTNSTAIEPTAMPVFTTGIPKTEKVIHSVAWLTTATKVVPTKDAP